ncbi:MAG: AAA family ATPase [Candidatus Ancaeobacter aquaticus]|nr:AAA family ATPase [Candidatus Ancaeobacter aquaticus]
MITKIELSDVASYKILTALATDKKVNLVYGLNGTGKSILSNFLYDKDGVAFSKCSIEGLNNEEILVYNQRFIQDHFYESDNLKGIFTLSKENKVAEETIRNAQNKITAISEEKASKTKDINTINSELSQRTQSAENKVWEIKTTYTGGDRVLEFCLEGLKGKKETLFCHISGLVKPESKPDKTTDELKKEVEPLQAENAERCNTITTITFTGHKIENETLFQKEIVGNVNSTVAELINKLDNSDWVKQGLEYLPADISKDGEPCPFCQEKTITQNVSNNIKDYFGESYENDIKELKKLSYDYETAINSIQSRETYESNPFLSESKTEFQSKYNQALKVLDDNKRKIEEKLKTPSQQVTFVDSSKVIKNLNQFINNANQKVCKHNQRIDNKEEVLNQIKKTFWNILRWDYDQTLSAYKKETDEAHKKSNNITKIIENLEKRIVTQKQIICEQQETTVNIEEAIVSINSGLTELGIDDFKIKKHSDNLYAIVRDEQDSDTFQTLSEGEKMIISFLYFLELCKGKKNASDVGQKKIIVIDDPISSLSHIYIFNIGLLIKNEFLYSDKYEQVFVLTHSLYFFYELTDINHERRKKDQKLFRLLKNFNGSQILNMKYEEIQNDYHSYWQIVKDDKQPPAVVANCMRNIIEYFFNFIEKKDLNNVFQKPELQNNKYQAFYRYINRESHSLGQNIFDYKEFNYDHFKEALGLVFKESGYKEHYEEMMKNP